MNNSDTNQAEQLNETAVKCRFFSQYFGQKVLKTIDNECLELKSIEKVTDDDIIEWMEYQEIFRKEKEPFLKRFRLSYTNETDFSSSFADFFRGKGYAVPFMKYSVSDLVKMGWIQLV